MILIPFVAESSDLDANTFSAKIKPYWPVLSFLSGSAALFRQDAPAPSRDLLIEPPTKDMAGELLYSAAYRGIPDAQYVLASWSFHAGNCIESIAWSKFVTLAESDAFLETRYYREAFGFGLAIQSSSAYRRLSSRDLSYARDRSSELKRQGIPKISARKLFADFLQYYVGVQSSNTVVDLSYLGFQILAANCADAAQLVFKEVTRLEPGSDVALAFNSHSSGLLGSKPDFKEILDRLSPSIKALNIKMSGIAIT